MTDRRSFIATSIATLLATTAADSSAQAEKHPPAGVPEQRAADRAEDPRITRAQLAGPEQVTRDATVAIMRVDGTMEVLVKGTNEWVCVPGDLDKIGRPPMCMNPMGMQWMSDAMTGKPRPTNTSPGMIYMLYGATQRSNTDPADKNRTGHPDRTALDDHVAVRRSRQWLAHDRSGQRCLGHVRWHTVFLFARMWFAVGWKRISRG